MIKFSISKLPQIPSRVRLYRDDSSTNSCSTDIFGTSVVNFGQLVWITWNHCPVFVKQRDSAVPFPSYYDELPEKNKPKTRVKWEYLEPFKQLYYQKVTFFSLSTSSVRIVNWWGQWSSGAVRTKTVYWIMLSIYVYHILLVCWLRFSKRAWRS